jgi:hypothetical protein
MVNPNKTKSQENAENNRNFKDLITKLNAITDKVGEVEAVVSKAADDSAPLREILAPTRNRLLEGTKVDQNMADIIGRFNGMIEESIKPILMEEVASNELSLAVKTKTTEAGVQVGDWEIIKIEENGFLSYDISNTENKKVILEDIKTYATANAIVKLLNLGEPINGEEIKKFLRMDEEFDASYQDALRYKRKYKKTGELVYEHRYQSCKGKAQQLKEMIKKQLDMMGI